MKKIMLLLIVGILLTIALSVDVYKSDAHDSIDLSDDGSSDDCIDGSTSNSSGSSGTSPGLKVLHLLMTSVSLPNTHIPIH